MGENKEDEKDQGLQQQDKSIINVPAAPDSTTLPQLDPGGGTDTTMMPPPVRPPEPKQLSNVILAPSQKPYTEGLLNIGGEPEGIEMPEEKVQRAGWYEPRAYLLFGQFPDLYKPIKRLKKTEGQE